MRYDKKKNRYERRQVYHEKLARSLEGAGLYEYQNRSNAADLQLPKPSADGKRMIGPGERFQGDSYFLQMVRRNELALVREIRAPEPKENIVGSEQKLILDQPDTVTTEGKVEHVVKGTKTSAKVSATNQESKESPEATLLTEDPLSGVVILG